MARQRFQTSNLIQSRQIQKSMQIMQNSNQELQDTATNLIINTPRTSCIYFLPKIHKPNNPGRPIVSICSCPTELISSYLDRIMTPIVKSLPSYIKDSTHALTRFHTRFQFLRPRQTYFHHGHYISVHRHSQ